MRIIYVGILWIGAAVLCTVLVLALIHGFPLVGQGLGFSQVLDRVLNALLDRTHILAYAALAGLVLALISLVPPVIRSNAERLVLWTVFGALSGAVTVGCCAFLYKGYGLFARGVAADSMPLLALLTDEMRLPALLPYGAIGGGGLALVMLVVALLKESDSRAAQRALSEAPRSDPDSIIRAQRTQRAQQYLAERNRATAQP